MSETVFRSESAIEYFKGLVDDARLYSWEAARRDFNEEQILEITHYS